VFEGKEANDLIGLAPDCKLAIPRPPEDRRTAMARTARPARRKVAPLQPRVSRTHVPHDTAPEAWQIALRRQFGREQRFLLENPGAEPVFSEVRVVHPATGGRYRVAIRGAGLGENYCSCPDFATNELGTAMKGVDAIDAKARKARSRWPRGTGIVPRARRGADASLPVSRS